MNWVLRFLEFDTDDFRQISNGMLESHGDRESDLTKPPEGVKDAALWFTGIYRLQKTRCP